MESLYIRSKTETDKCLSTSADYYQKTKANNFRKKYQTFYPKKCNTIQKKDKQHTKSTSYKYSIPKAARFSKSVCSHSDISILDIPDTKSKVGTSMGFGQKIPISKNILRKAEENPSPSAYFRTFSNMQLKSSERINGRTFATSIRQSQQKRFISHRKDVYSAHFTIKNPGYIYNVNKKQKKSIILAQRLKTFTQKMSKLSYFVPGPKYYPQQCSKTLKGPSFKTSLKINIAKPLNENPGPQYDIKGFSDKYKIKSSKYKNK